MNMVRESDSDPAEIEIFDIAALIRVGESLPPEDGWQFFNSLDLMVLCVVSAQSNKHRQTASDTNYLQVAATHLWHALKTLQKYVPDQMGEAERVIERDVGVSLSVSVDEQKFLPGSSIAGKLSHRFQMLAIDCAQQQYLQGKHDASQGFVSRIRRLFGGSS